MGRGDPGPAPAVVRGGGRRQPPARLCAMPGCDVLTLQGMAGR